MAIERHSDSELIMGLFDEIRCELPLPDGWNPGEKWFQTKSFPDPLMQRYIISSRGRLIDSQGNDLEPDGYIAFYAQGDERDWREYRARFRDGDLSEITVVTDANDGRVYGLASFRWFNAPTFMFGEEEIPSIASIAAASKCSISSTPRRRSSLPFARFSRLWS